MRPDGYNCSGCPHWDDINGCWVNARSIGSCDECYEEGGTCYDEDEACNGMDEEDMDAEDMYEEE